MNRSRYVAQQPYAMSPYPPQAFGIGPVPTPAQMPGAGGMMHPGMPPQVSGFPNPQQQAQQAAFGSPNPNAMGASPVLQQAMSPSALWTAQFANGPIIEDLCAPPPHHHPHHMGLASPPLNALPPRGPGMMQMPQVQNVYGLRQPPAAGFMIPPQHQGRLTVPGAAFAPPPGYGMPMGMQQQMQMQMQLQFQQAQAQAQAQAQQHQRQQQLEMEMELAGMAQRQGGQVGLEAQQADSPQLRVVTPGSATPAQGMPLTPVETALSGFLTAEI